MKLVWLMIGRAGLAWDTKSHRENKKCLRNWTILKKSTQLLQENTNIFEGCKIV